MMAVITRSSLAPCCHLSLPLRRSPLCRWYRKVLARYETTVALPIEYGALKAASALTGLLFYRERLQLKSWQLTCTSVGVVLILAGIAIGMLDARACGSGLNGRRRARVS